MRNPLRSTAVVVAALGLAACAGGDDDDRAKTTVDRTPVKSCTRFLSLPFDKLPQGLQARDTVTVRAHIDGDTKTIARNVQVAETPKRGKGPGQVTLCTTDEVADEVTATATEGDTTFSLKED